jgi:outer membrane protein
MKKIFTVFTMFFVLAFVAGAFAGESRIGYVDLQRAMNKSEHGKNVKIELEGIVKEKTNAIEELANKRNAIQKDLEKSRMVMSEEAVRAKIDEIKKLERQAEQMINASNEDLSKLQRDKEFAILKELDDIITKIGKEGGYMIILPSEVVLFAPDGSSITNEVIKRYNALKGLTPVKE